MNLWHTLIVIYMELHALELRFLQFMAMGQPDMAPMIFADAIINKNIKNI